MEHCLLCGDAFSTQLPGARGDSAARSDLVWVHVPPCDAHLKGCHAAGSLLMMDCV